ncbi:MAG: hypothetical protein EOM25_10290 [Deltaproteobacteria bacterium]|nr:hypothetical protein [Deltaproteobacteria bacterium]
MITINLLPKQKRAKAANIQKEVALFILILLFALACMFSISRWMAGEIRNFEMMKAEKERIKAELLAQVKRVNELERLIASVSSKIDAIRSIREEQGLSVRYIDEILVSIPQSKIWFESFSLSVAGDIQVKGVSLDNQAFADFVDRLRKSPYIAQVQTKGTSRKEIQGLGLVQFDCLIVARKPQAVEGGNG